MKEISISEFADRLSEILPAMMKEFLRRQVKEIYKGKITLPQFVVLEFLKRSGLSKMKDLASLMDVSMPTTTGIVERLVRDGYAERISDPDDRRVIKIKLTLKGHNLVERILEARRKMIINIFGKISENDRRDYLRILTKIKGILTEGKRE